MLLLAAASPAAAAVSGAIYGEDGKPVAKAEVRAYRAEDSAGRRVRLASGGERAMLASATTGEDGSFSLNAKSGGVIDLVVTKDGFAPKRYLTTANDDAVALALSAAPPRVVRVAADGKPVRGAKVIATEELFHELLLGETNEQGELTIPDPKGWAERLLVLHPDYAIGGGEARGRASLTFALTRGIRAAGKVVDARGKPVAKATLLADGWPIGESGEDGTFSVPVAKAGARIEARTTLGRGSAVQANKEMSIVLEPGRTIAGSVRDADRRPMAGLPVAVYVLTTEPPGHEPIVAVADEKGEFRVDQLPASRHTVAGWPLGDLEFDSPGADLRTKELVRVELTATAQERLRGFVRNEKNEPVGGATVSYLHPQAPLVYASMPDEMPIARTAPDGSFRLNAPGGTPEMRLVAIHQNYAAGVSQPLAAEQKGKPVAITLRNGIEVNGLVSDPDGKPVAGTAVVLVQDPGSMAQYPFETVIAAGAMRAFVSSGADGTFRLRLNPTVHDVVFWKEGYAPLRQKSVALRAGDSLRAVLERGVSIDGRIVRKDGTPVTEGRVFVRRTDGSGGRADVDAGGAFSVGSLVPGQYHVTFGGKEGRAEKVVVAPATGVVLELAANGELRGTVTDKATGMPLERFSVRANAENNDFENTATFTLPVPAGRTDVRVSSEGYVATQRVVIVDAGKSADVAFALSPSRSIRGRVVGPNGTPLAEVMVYPETEADEGLEDAAETDADGSFQLDEVRREPITLVVNHKGFLTRRVDVALDAPQPLTIVLAKGRTVSGRVVDEGGRGVEGASVWGASVAHDGESQGGESGADGAFRIEGLSDGRHTFRAEKEGVGEVEVRDVDVTRGTPLVLTLKGTGPTGALHGTVTGFDSTRFMAGYVTARSGNGRSLQAMVQRDGTYRIDKVPAGEVTVRATANGIRSEASSPKATVTMTAGADLEVNLAFRDDIVVSGTVTADGQPAIGHDVMFRSDDGSWRTSSGANGSYEVRGLEPGVYTVRVIGERTFTTRLDVTGSTTFDIKMDYSTIAGRVVDADGAPIDGAKVHAEAPDSGLMEYDTQVVTDAAGAFELVVPPGSYTVFANKKGYATVTQRSETGTRSLLLTLVATAGLRVRLTDARDGTTLGGYAVATDARGTQQARVNEQERDGALNLPLASGSYRVSVSADGYASQTVQASVPTEGELRIRLTPGGTLVVHTNRDATELVKLVLPGGVEYIRCHCNGIAEIRLTGRTTTIEHVAPGNYTMQVLDARGKVISSVPVIIGEGQTTSAEVNLP